ncbi:MAG: response regulator [Pseudomonadota bacterium]
MAETKPTHGFHILVVEDDPSTQFMMAEMLDSLGYSFAIARSGDECMARLAERPDWFGLILMDLHIPKCSGLHTSLRIRSAHQNPPRDTPIVALTADSAYHSDDAVAPYGINTVLPKPVGLRTLDPLIAGIAKAA